MTKYCVNYNAWGANDIQKLGDLLNDLMTTLNRVYANDDEEASWLRRFEKDLDFLIDDVWQREEANKR